MKPLTASQLRRMNWGYKFVGTDLATNNHAGGRHRWRLGEWHKAAQPTLHSDPCPRHPGDGLCVARTLAGAQSGGARLGTSVMVVVGYLPGDVLAETADKVRVRQLWVHPDPVDPVRVLTGQGADLQGAVLQGAVLRNADLRGADLRNAVLQGAVLRNAVLRGADLRNAVLRGADLRNAVLQGADLQGADLQHPPPGWTLTANGFVVRSDK